MTCMIPQRAGFWWAQWRIADDDTPEGDKRTPSHEWEVVHVVEDFSDSDDSMHLMVAVPGVARCQPVENFFWGPGPLETPRRKARSREKVSSQTV